MQPGKTRAGDLWLRIRLKAGAGVRAGLPSRGETWLFSGSMSSPREKPRLSRPAWLCLGYLLLHTLAHVSAYWFEVKPGVSISIWYPPAGLALALMVLLGPRVAPLVFFANWATAWITPEPRVPWTAFFFPGLITICYGATAWWVRRSLGPRLLPGGRRETVVFCLAMGVAPLLPALAGTAAVDAAALMGRELETGEFFRSVFHWWLGDASGLLVVVPAAIVFGVPWLERAAPAMRPPARRREAFLALVRGAALLGTLILVVAVPVLRDHSAFYLCFLPLIWICMYHGLPGATLATLLTMMVGLVGMRLAGTTAGFAYIFLLFEVAVAGVGLGLGSLVTRREEAEGELAASQARLDRVIDGAKLGVWEMDLASRRLESNARLPALLGYEGGELAPLERTIPGLVHEADLPAVKAAWRDHLGGRRELFEAELRLRTRDGRWRWIQSRGSIMEWDGQGRPLRVSGTQTDITDRKRAEAEAARLSRIVEASPDFIFTSDRSGRVIYANTALLALCGRPDAAVAERPALEALLPGGAEAAARWRTEAMPAALAAGSWQGEGMLTDAAGRSLPTSQVVIARHDEEEAGVVFSFVLRDITDQKQAEEERRQRDRELLQLQKAESLGVMAGGIAHDFNNLLTAIVGNANLARVGLEPEARAQDYLDNVEQAAERAARLCHQMLAYAGRNPVAFAEVDLGALVRDVGRLLESSISRRIRLHFEAERPLAPILAAETQMQQVAMNLILNAAEAIGDREGDLTVRTSSQALSGEALARLFPGQKVLAGFYTLLEVEDTGAGMTPEVQARIFEPFFTTKFTGQGLGLAAVGGVVKSHRGHISVCSAPGRGTLFRLAFPAQEGAGVAPAAADPGSPARKDSGLVLLVDDDALIREVGAGILDALGFSTVTAKDGIEGVARFREHAGRIKAVMLDLTMPRMDGFEAHAEMHRINPKVPVVLMSGFSSKLENLPPEAIHPAGVLSKPFGMAQLRERLGAVMAG